MGKEDEVRSKLVLDIMTGAQKNASSQGKGDIGGSDSEYLRGGVPFNNSDMAAGMAEMGRRRQEIENCEDKEKKIALQKQFLKDLVATLNAAVQQVPQAARAVIYMAAEAQRRVDKVFTQENPGSLALPKIFKEQ